MLTRVIFNCLLFFVVGILFVGVGIVMTQWGHADNSIYPQPVSGSLNPQPLEPSQQENAPRKPDNSAQKDDSPLDRILSKRDRRSSMATVEIRTDPKLGRFLLNTRCRVKLIHDIEVPALEAGQIKEILVKENQEVTPDTLIAQLRDDAARLQREVAIKNRNVAKVDAQNVNRIKYAQKSLEFAKDIYVRKERLYNESQSINFVEFREAQYQESQAQLQLDEAYTQQKVAQEKLSVEEVNIRAADDLIDRHRVKCLLEKGQVAEIFVQVGEWVNRGDKVARVIDMRNLKIEGRADARSLYPEQLADRPVIVTVKLPNDQTETLQGRVVKISLENSFSDTFFFEVHVTNQLRGNYWMLRPNMEVDIRVLLDQK